MLLNTEFYLPTLGRADEINTIAEEVTAVFLISLAQYIGKYKQQQHHGHNKIIITMIIIIIIIIITILSNY